MFRNYTYFIETCFLNVHRSHWQNPGLLFMSLPTNDIGFLLLTVAPTGDHVISLVDEISFVFPPSPPLSQVDDIPPEQFCNGDNRPADCGSNCMCTHKVDIPLNAVVEVVLVDEGKLLSDLRGIPKLSDIFLNLHSVQKRSYNFNDLKTTLPKIFRTTSSLSSI